MNFSQVNFGLCQADIVPRHVLKLLGSRVKQGPRAGLSLQIEHGSIEFNYGLHP